MEISNIIKGKTEEEIWAQINEQLGSEADMMEYSAIIQQGDTQIILAIDIDPGGGFESGFESTSLKAILQPPPSFTFALHEEHFIDEIGKFFGMEDVRIGYDDFDKKLIVKTSDKVKVRKIFSDISLRVFFQNMHDFSLGITKHTQDNQETFSLELDIERGINEPHELRKIYHAFLAVIEAIYSTAHS